MGGQPAAHDPAQVAPDPLLVDPDQSLTPDASLPSYWIGPRHAFERTAIARLAIGDFRLTAAYLTPDDDPNTGTELWHADAEYGREGLGTLGAGHARIFDSELGTRDGMDVYDLRAIATPLAPTGVLPGLTLAGELVLQDNGDVQEGGAWYGEVGYDFAGLLPWSPYVSYRYARFSGDDPDSDEDEGYDPLFYSSSDWGSWDQGEILGEYVVENSNLKTHAVRLALHPTERVTVSLLYYYFLIDEPRAAGWLATRSPGSST